MLLFLWLRSAHRDRLRCRRGEAPLRRERGGRGEAPAAPPALPLPARPRPGAGVCVCVPHSSPLSGLLSQLGEAGAGERRRLPPCPGGWLG